MLNFSESLDLKIDKDSIIIAIPSIIHTPPDKGKISHQDRLSQTIKQLESINEYKNKHKLNIHTILLEMSFLSEKEKTSLLPLCDNLISFADDKNAYFCCIRHHNKSEGEKYVLTCLGKILLQKDFKWFFKFGGRYYLDDRFEIKKFLKDKPVVSIFHKEYAVEPVIYSIPQSYFESYITFFSTYLIWIDMERSLYCYINGLDKYYTLDFLGVSGIGAKTEKFNML